MARLLNAIRGSLLRDTPNLARYLVVVLQRFAPLRYLLLRRLQVSAVIYIHKVRFIFHVALCKNKPKYVKNRELCRIVT